MKFKIVDIKKAAHLVTSEIDETLDCEFKIIKIFEFWNLWFLTKREEKRCFRAGLILSVEGIAQGSIPGETRFELHDEANNTVPLIEVALLGPMQKQVKYIEIPCFCRFLQNGNEK